MSDGAMRGKAAPGEYAALAVTPEGFLKVVGPDGQPLAGGSGSTSPLTLANGNATAPTTAPEAGSNTKLLAEILAKPFVQADPGTTVHTPIKVSILAGQTVSLNTVLQGSAPRLRCVGRCWRAITQ